MAKLNQQLFMDAFSALPEITDDAAALKELLAGVPEENRPEAEKSFYDTLRIMKAKTPSEVDDISVMDILKCFTYQYIFNEIFSSAKGGTYTVPFLRGFRVQKNYRVRRIL